MARIDAIRKAKRQRRGGNLKQVELVDGLGYQKRRECEEHLNELRELFDEFLDRLDNEFDGSILMLRREGKSFKEIAANLGASKTSIIRHFNALRLQLKQIFETSISREK